MYSAPKYRIQKNKEPIRII